MNLGVSLVPTPHLTQAHVRWLGGREPRPEDPCKGAARVPAVHPPARRQTVWASDSWVPREPAWWTCPQPILPPCIPETATAHSWQCLHILLLLPGHRAPLHLPILKCLGKSLRPVSSSRPLGERKKSKRPRTGQAVGCGFKAKGRGPSPSLGWKYGCLHDIPAHPGNPLSSSLRTNHMGNDRPQAFSSCLRLCQSRFYVEADSFH